MHTQTEVTQTDLTRPDSTQPDSTQSWVERLSRDEAEECLTNLRGLAGELDDAMQAIVNRQLPSLQGSIYLQQASCARLAAIRHRANDRLKLDAMPDEGPIDSDLAAEIEAAKDTLLKLNRRYSALLKHSKETLRMLAGLYCAYLGSAQPATGIQSNLQTWSCEV